MIPAFVLPLPPLAAALLLLAWRPRPGLAGRVGLVAAALGAGLAMWPVFAPGGIGTGTAPGSWLRSDALNLWLVGSGALAGLAAAALLCAARAGAARMAALQGLLAAHHVALLADHPALVLAALAIALIAVAALLAAGDDGAARAAAWRLLLAGGTGLFLAGFGTALLLAGGAASWIAAPAAAAAPVSALMAPLAFAFLLAGYGVPAGLLPWQNAPRPAPEDARENASAAGVGADRHDAPAALFLATALAAGLLPPAALHALLRAAALTGNAVPAPGTLLALGGALALLLAGAVLWRGRNGDDRGAGPARVLAWAGVGHGGIAALAFGCGLPLAGALHLAGLALAGGAHALATAHGGPVSRAAARLALAGAPPSPLFVPALLVLAALAAESPVLALPPLAGMALLGGAVLTAPPTAAPQDHGLPMRLAPWPFLVLAAALALFTPEALRAAAAVLR